MTRRKPFPEKLSAYDQERRRKRLLHEKFRRQRAKTRRKKTGTRRRGDIRGAYAESRPSWARLDRNGVPAFLAYLDQLVINTPSHKNWADRQRAHWLENNPPSTWWWPEERYGAGISDAEQQLRDSSKPLPAAVGNQIWTPPPQGYSDWLQSNRAAYGSGMASGAAGNPWEGYLRYSREHYDNDKTGIGYRIADENLSDWLSRTSKISSATPADPPADPPADRPPIRSPGGGFMGYGEGGEKMYGAYDDQKPPGGWADEDVTDDPSSITTFGGATDDQVGDNENVIRNSFNKPRVTSQTFR